MKQLPLVIGSISAAILLFCAAILLGVPSNYVDSKRTQVITDISKSPSQHEKDVKSINDAWDSIRLGDLYSKNDQLVDAANSYQKAYYLDKGSRAVSGLLLAMTHEKLGRNDEGIQLLDQMIQNGELSPNGIKNANEIKTRLLAAKQAAAEQGAQNSGDT